MHLLSLPTVMLEHIMSFMTYDQVARTRAVCKDFDSVCQRVLNRGFQLVEKRLVNNLKALKAQLPRRESERRYHPLAKHCDILVSIETRVSMLNMAYSRFIEQGKCCFIPGKILDELHRVLSLVNQSKPLPMPLEVLQELRDISGMAIEHFDEAVAPALRQRAEDAPPKIKTTPSNPAVGTSVEMALLREACLKNNKNIQKIEKRNNLLNRKLELYKRMMTLAKRQMIQKQLEQSHKIAELKRKVDEFEIKFGELLQIHHSEYKSNFRDDSIIKPRITNLNPPLVKLIPEADDRKHYGSIKDTIQKLKDALNETDENQRKIIPDFFKKFKISQGFSNPSTSNDSRKLKRSYSDMVKIMTPANTKDHALQAITKTLSKLVGSVSENNGKRFKMDDANL